VTDSVRKQDLLEAAYQYVLGNGLADMSLRPLAKEIGSSPRVLLFLFGSKEDLIRALLARAREEELRYLGQLRSGDGLAATGRDVWGWLAAPSHRALLSLWVEGYARSLLGREHHHRTRRRPSQHLLRPRKRHVPGQRPPGHPPLHPRLTGRLPSPARGPHYRMDRLQLAVSLHGDFCVKIIHEYRPDWASGTYCLACMHADKLVLRA
jgi:AcrR family transcriptional regulator